MQDNLVDQTRVDRRPFDLTPFAEAEPADRAHWRSRAPDERLEALELCRQVACGSGPTTRGLSRLVEVAEFPPG